MRTELMERLAKAYISYLADQQDQRDTSIEGPSPERVHDLANKLSREEGLDNE